MTVDFSLEARILAPMVDVFWTSLDIDAHLASMEASGETSVQRRRRPDAHGRPHQLRRPAGPLGSIAEREVAQTPEWSVELDRPPFLLIATRLVG